MIQERETNKLIHQEEEEDNKLTMQQSLFETLQQQGFLFKRDGEHLQLPTSI